MCQPAEKKAREREGWRDEEREKGAQYWAVSHEHTAPLRAASDDPQFCHGSHTSSDLQGEILSVILIKRVCILSTALEFDFASLKSS